jgi:ubiquinone/menaquinone biosynthesis C-methylase UbiE
MKINNPEKRLSQFWGKVDQKHIHSFLPFVSGKNILDMGCGYGTTTFSLQQKGFHCIGIDYQQSAIDFCKKKYPTAHFQCANAENLPFEEGYFDTVILRDALHHFYGEADFEKVKNEILRVSAKNATIIFFDPNVNLMLKTLRKLSFHEDEECQYEDAVQIVKDMNLAQSYSEFNTLFSLPLSGGYVGLNFTPNSEYVQDVLLKVEYVMEALVNKIRMGRYFCWRYLIVCKKK